MKIEKTLFLPPMHKKLVQAPTDMRKNSYPQNTMNRHLINLLGKRHGATGLWALLVVVCTLGFALPAKAANVKAISATLNTTKESCPSGAIDPGETNTVAFVFRNATTSDMKDVTITLKNRVGGVEFSLTSGQKVTIPKESNVTLDFMFRTDGACGSTLMPDFTVGGGATGLDDASKFQLAVGQVLKPVTAKDGGAVTINDNAKAGPFPSSINLSGLAQPVSGSLTAARISKVTVKLNSINHGYSSDVTVMLKKGAKSVVLMRNVGVGSPLDSGTTLTFADSGSALPPSTKISSGTFRPTDYGSGAVSDQGSPSATTLSTFEGDSVDPNGDWQLFVVDTASGATGTIGSWTLELEITSKQCCGVGQTFPTITRTTGDGGAAGIADKSIAEDAKDVVIATFDVKDLETATDKLLALQVTSSDQSLIKDSSITKTLSGSTFTLKGTAEANQNNVTRGGPSTITVVASDPEQRTATTTFKVNVDSANDTPTVTEIRGQSANKGQTVGPLEITIGDVETPANNLIISVDSDNKTLVPNSNIQVSSSGSTRQVTVRPFSATANGVALITIKVDDGNSTGEGGGAKDATSQFKVKFTTEAGDPTIEPLKNQSTDEDTTKTVPFIVKSNSANAVTNLTTTATIIAGETLLASVSTSGTSNDRTLTIVPAANKHGTATVKVEVKDPSNNKTDNTGEFTVTINAVNDAPTISAIAEQTINEDASTADIAFTIGDVETPPGELAIAVASSNIELVATTDVTFGGSGANRTIKVQPKANKFGKAELTVSVTDKGAQNDGTNPATASQKFIVNVSPVNDAPTINKIVTTDAGTINNDSPPTLVTVDEDDSLNSDGTPKERTITLEGIGVGPSNESEQSVTITATSDNTGLIANPTIDPAKIKTSGNATLKYTTAKDKNGTATITLTLTDDGAPAATTVKKFKIAVNAVNDTPTIDAIAPQETPKNTGISVTFVAKDVETTPAALLTINVTQGGEGAGYNANLIDAIELYAANTKLTIIPKNGQLGKRDITLTATDKGEPSGSNVKTSAAVTFTLTVSDIAPPTISFAKSSDTIDEDTVAVATISLEDNKNLDPAKLSWTSSNADLVPAANVLFSGIPTGASSTTTGKMVVVPVANANSQNLSVTGPVTITVTYTDDEKLSRSATYALTVAPVADTPTISLSKTTVTVNEDVTQVKDGDKDITITVADADAPNNPEQLSTKAEVQGGDAKKALFSSVTINGTGATRTVVVVPTKDKFDTAGADIKLTVTDPGGLSRETTLHVNLTPVNDPPTIDKPANVSINEDSGEQSVTLKNVTVGPDNERTAGADNVTTQNQALKDPNGIVASANDKGKAAGVNTLIDVTQQPTAGNGYVLKFKPKSAQFGTSVITVTVTDTGDGAASVSFEVQIDPRNHAPTVVIAEADKVVNTTQSTLTRLVAFTLNDAETLPRDLKLEFTSDNPELVPNVSSSFILTGSDGARGVLVQPAAEKFGTTKITIKVTDAGKAGQPALSGQSDFTVNVTAGVAPTISTIPNQTLNVGDFSEIISFTVGDAQTPAAALVVTAKSQNTAIIAQANIQIASVSSASPSTRQMIVKAGDTPGTADIEVTVKDGDDNATKRTFSVTVRGEKPKISSILNQTIAKGSSTGPIPFTVSDKETFPGFLQVSGRSSNQVFVPNANVVIGGSAGSRTVTVTAAANQEGDAVITLTVTDNEGQTASIDFTVATPPPVNDAPTITSIQNQTTNRDKTTPVMAFTVGDDQTAVGSLVVTASSSLKTLVPDGNIFLGGSGANRTVFIQPATGQEGSTTITITVTDNGPGPAKSASTSFTLTVKANEAPTISAILGQTTERNRPTSSISFTVGDKETEPASLAVAATTSDVNIVAVSGIALGGSGANRTVVVTPASNAVGSATITLTVTDGGGITASTSFTLKVTQPPAVKGDFNGDGQSDLLFQDNDGFLAVWLMNGTTLSSAGFTLPSNVGDAAFRVATTGDFDRDGSDDIIFQHTDGSLAIWFMNGSLQNSGALINPSNPGDSRWRVVGAADLNRDGKLDLVFQHSDGTLAVWYMDGTSLSSAALLSPASPGDSKWKVVGVGDLTGDGREDLVFQYSDGTMALWAMNGTTLTTASLLSPSNPGSGWRVAGTGKISKAFSVALTGAAERPNPVTTTATGSGKLTIVGNQLSFNITYSGLSGVATGAHIHLPASTEQTAGVSINFQAFNGGAFGTSGSLVGTVTLTAEQLAAIVGGQAYVNVHTAANAGGEIRGQIVSDASAASKVDLIFQSATRDLAVWFLDGTKLRSAQLLTPSNSGGTWTLVAPK
ncbi:MAG: CHRD domain-containing protein [Verrucomicrobia bacterium]|nr:CHRD domain-containing protein [Verrucomicrobiota bacterium]